MAEDDDDDDGENIRAFLGSFIGCTLVDVTQHDADEFKKTRESRVYLHFSNGATLSFPVEDGGFDIDTPD